MKKVLSNMPNSVDKVIRGQAYVLMTVALGALALSAESARWATSGPFTLVEPIKQYRRQQAATPLLDGKVLVAGQIHRRINCEPAALLHCTPTLNHK